MVIVTGAFIGLTIWFVLRFLISGIYTVDQNERAVKTVFGRAERLALQPAEPAILTASEQERYRYPQVRVIPPGGPYFKLPWETIHKVSIATQTINMATDLEDPRANAHGTVLEAVTKDQLNTGMTGQIRYRIAEDNLYPYLFGIKRPIVHVMGYFVSVLRQKIANFEPAPVEPRAAEIAAVSINDIRKNLRELNEYMDIECASTAARYGVALDASLITGIDPPHEVEAALAAINTAHNQVSSDISLAQAAADQKLMQSRRALEIETLKAEAEIEPLRLLAAELHSLHRRGPHNLAAYVRNVRLPIYSKAERAFLETRAN